MSKDKEIKFDDINYAIYKIGSWNNDYKINLIGKSNEIPITKPTIDHVILSMKEIRKSNFKLKGENLNGILALVIQLNNELKTTPIKELIAIEKKEYDSIMGELNDLKLEDPKKSINLDNQEYLIYKLEKKHHITSAKPVSKFTEKHHLQEIEKLKNKQ
ncbi:MAG: hypothetical protein LBV42_03270 [Methanobrevibacter sp.]|jgi:hypothetical protein|nr:hypothetical protein [Methanobrevibacter sp.]